MSTTAEAEARNKRVYGLNPSTRIMQTSKTARTLRNTHLSWPAFLTSWLLRHRMHPRLRRPLLELANSDGPFKPGPDYVALGRPPRRAVEYDCGGLGRDALSGRRLRRLATQPGEKSGLVFLGAVGGGDFMKHSRLPAFCIIRLT